jgi:hypothetical protein
MKRRSIILFLSFLTVIVSAQVGSEKLKPDSLSGDRLQRAITYYNSGQFLECISEIELILEKYELKKTDKVKALETGARAAVEMGQTGVADSYVNVMLKTFPHYDLKEEENPELFNRLVKKYIVHPAVIIGVRNTADWMNYKTISIFSYNGLQYDAPYIKKLQGILNDFGLMYYGWGEIQFNRYFSINGDLTFKWISYNRQLTEGSPYTLKLWEQDNYMEIPIYAKRYFYPWKNVLTYVTAGFGWLFMTGSTGNVSIYYPAADSSNFTGDISLLPYRNRSTFEWLAGTGIGYKYRNLRMFIDARYYGGLNSITNPEKAAANETLVNDFRYVDNRIRLTQFELGASISYTLFNSVKRKR